MERASKSFGNSTLVRRALVFKADGSRVASEIPVEPPDESEITVPHKSDYSDLKTEFSILKSMETNQFHADNRLANLERGFVQVYQMMEEMRNLLSIRFERHIPVFHCISDDQVVGQSILTNSLMFIRFHLSKASPVCIGNSSYVALELPEKLIVKIGNDSVKVYFVEKNHKYYLSLDSNAIYPINIEFSLPIKAKPAVAGSPEIKSTKVEKINGSVAPEKVEDLPSAVKTEEPPKVEEAPQPAKVEESPKVEEPVKIEELPKPIDLAKVEEVSKTEEPKLVKQEGGLKLTPAKVEEVSKPSLAKVEEVSKPLLAKVEEPARSRVKPTPVDSDEEDTKKKSKPKKPVKQETSSEDEDAVLAARKKAAAKRTGKPVPRRR
jgi:hypothetical protein